MSWSWRFARIAGIGVYVHATFVILLGLIGLSGYRQRGAQGALFEVGFMLLVFGAVLLHELGHALAARRYGIPTRDITLLPIGGVARLERMPRVPRQELVIALAGPAVNVVLAALFAVVLLALGRPLVPAGAGDDGIFAGGGGLLQRLLWVNVGLVAFNAIPAFPLDGGRVLRALMAMKSGDYGVATRRAATIGKAFALLFGFMGLTGRWSPMFVFIALFVWMAAAAEAAAIRAPISLEGVAARAVMITDLRTLSAGDSLAHAMELTLAGFQQDFPVLDADRLLIGVLTRRDLFRGLGERGADAPVGDFMHRGFAQADPDEPADDAVQRLRDCDCQAVPVVRGRELLGVITLDNVAEYLMLQQALRRAA